MLTEKVKFRKSHYSPYFRETLKVLPYESKNATLSMQTILREKPLVACKILDERGWESNAPRPATRPATGFEDQEAHRDLTTPTCKDNRRQEGLQDDLSLCPNIN